MIMFSGLDVSLKATAICVLDQDRADCPTRQWGEPSGGNRGRPGAVSR